MDYPIDKRLIFVVDGEAYERDVEPGEIVEGLFELLMKIFDVFLCDARIVPCVNIEEMQFKIASMKEVPGTVLIDIKENKDLKRIIDLKQKFPGIKFFVVSTDNSMAIADEASEVTAISAKKIKISNLFEGVIFLKK